MHALSHVSCLHVLVHRYSYLYARVLLHCFIASLPPLPPCLPCLLADLFLTHLTHS